MPLHNTHPLTEAKNLLVFFFFLFFFYYSTNRPDQSGTICRHNVYLRLTGGSCFLGENNERDPQRARSLRSFKPATSHSAPCAVNGDVIWRDRRVTLGWGPLWMKRGRGKKKKRSRFECGKETTASKTSHTVCCQCFHPLGPARHLNANTLTWINQPSECVVSIKVDTASKGLERTEDGNRRFSSGEPHASHRAH